MDLKKNLYNDLSTLSKVWSDLSEDMQDVISKAIVGEKISYLLCGCIETLSNFNKDYEEIEEAVENITR
jgi:hypothetical protein